MSFVRVTKSFVAVAATIVTTSLSGTASGFAAEVPTLTIRGFSSDGSTFTFEERGRSDGSGHAFANIYVIDTATDKWVAGTPIRVGREGEGESEWKAILRARGELRAKGLEESEYKPGNSVAAYRPAQVGVNKYEASFYINPDAIDVAVPQQLEMEVYSLPSSLSYCQGRGFETKGYRLKYGREDAASLKLIHEDTRLPKSRGCVKDYEIVEVRTFKGWQGFKVAAIIGVKSSGFEGSTSIRYQGVILQ